MMCTTGNATSTMSLVFGSLASLWRRQTPTRAGAAATSARGGNASPAAQPAGALTPLHHGMRVRNNPRPRPPLRVVRVVEAGVATPLSGRMRISGRMADVCAELDRMADREAALHA